MVKSSEFAKLKEVFFEARTVYRAAKLALKEDPENPKCKMDVKTTKKAWSKAKTEKENFSSKRKEHSEVESPSKKIKSDPEKYNPARYKVTNKCETVCVTNLAAKITAENMKRFFGGCGGVEKLHFPRNEENDEFVGHCLVKFFSKIGAGRAVKLSGQQGYEIFFADGGDETKWNWQNYAKNICYRFLKGYCSQGSRCPFTHSRGDCFDFSNGHCARGDSCKFEHGGEKKQNKTKSKSNQCLDFLRDNCSRGDSCKFDH